MNYQQQKQQNQQKLNMGNSQASQPKPNPVDNKPKWPKSGDEPKKKNWIFSLIILVAVVLIIFTASNKNKEKSTLSTVEGCAEGDVFSQTTGEPCFDDVREPCQEGEVYNLETGEPCEEVVETSEVPTPVNGNMGYEDALVAYAGESILFDANCSPVPNVLEVALGSRVLVANNSTVFLQASVLGREVNLRPYHYMLSSGFHTAGEFPVSCNGVTSATISVK